MDFSSLLHNFLNPPVLFFFLGMLAVAIKTELEIPPQIVKFLSIYLLFDIGIKGGEELHNSGFSLEILKVMVVCIGFSFATPFAVYYLLRKKLNAYDSGAVAASYGSVSAVTFATAIAFLESHQITFGGYMVANMALMESPAVIAGLILITKHTKNDGNDEIKSKHVGGFLG
ncbi:MAG: sodium-dependent bicarbonate transport family permease, partial [Cytophagales bacterium]